MSTHLVWPVDRFYWSVLELPGIKRPRPFALGQNVLLEDDVPFDSACLHAVVVPLADGRVGVCSIDFATLRDLPLDALSLTPESLPTFLQGYGVEPKQFNLLTGRFEPASIRQNRTRNHAWAAATIMLSVSLIALGLHRRTVHWRESASAASAQRSALIADAVPSQTSGALTALSNQLGSVKEVLGSERQPMDAAVLLAQVLETWPTQVSAKPQSISVNQTGAVIAVAVDGDPTPFLRALAAPSGWELDEPRLNTSGTVSRVSLQLRWMGGSSGAY